MAQEMEEVHADAVAVTKAAAEPAALEVLQAVKVTTAREVDREVLVE